MQSVQQSRASATPQSCNLLRVQNIPGRALICFDQESCKKAKHGQTRPASSAVQNVRDLHVAPQQSVSQPVALCGLRAGVTAWKRTEAHIQG